jgi:hypothetical protein
MHGPMNVKSPNNISKWQMGFNSAFKGLISNVLDPLQKMTSNYRDKCNRLKFFDNDPRRLKDVED